MGCREEPVIPLHSLDTVIYAIRAYLLPCNHRKACRETKWTIHDRAPPANSKQISIRIEDLLIRGLCAWYRMANGPQLRTVPFLDKRCIHTSRKDRLLCSTLFVSPSAEKHFRCQNNKKYIPILREILVTHEYPDLRMSFNYLTGQNRDSKRALRSTKLPSLLANSALINQGLRSHPAVLYQDCTTWNWGSECHSTISSQFHFPISLPNFTCILYNREQKSVYLAARRKLKVSVLSANFKKCRFCNFSCSYTKCSPSE